MLRQRSAAARINHDGVNYSDRFIMRPSIARMTLDLDYGDVAMENNNKRATEALSHRLAELLVFEIRQDGDTQFQTLSVRGLYKYVLKSIRFSGEKQPRSSNPKLLTNSHAEYMNQRKQEKANCNKQKGSKSNFESTGGEKNDSDSSSSSSSSHSGDDEAEERHRDLLGQRKSSSGSTTVGVEGKSVTFGGSQGPIVTEHPPKELPEANNTTKQESTNVHSEDGLTEDQDSVHSKERHNHHHHHHHHEITYRERLGAFLHPRDLRRLTSPFSATNEPELIVRRHVMLLNFDPLRAVVLRDRLLVLVPDGADSLLVDLENRVRGGSREVERSIFGETTHPASQAESSNIGDSQHSVSVASVGTDNGRNAEKKRKHATAILKKVSGAMTHHEPKGTMTGKTTSNVSSDNDSTAPGGHFEDSASEFQEWDEMESRDWIDLPFELQCLDAVLGSVCTILGKDTGELQSTSLRAMDRLLHHGSNQGEEILRHMKNSVKEMTGRVKGFIRAMNLVLDETEDMALMNLSRLLTHPDRFIQPVPEEILNEESDEPELILEAHLQQAFSLTNSLDLVRGEIETTQELINQRLDAVRNRLLLANMIISVGSLCVALGSFIGSIFGMNVINHIEEDPDAFKQIVIGTCFSMVGLVFLVGIGLWYAGTLPNLRSSL